MSKQESEIEEGELSEGELSNNSEKQSDNQNDKKHQKKSQRIEEESGDEVSEIQYVKFEIDDEKKKKKKKNKNKNKKKDKNRKSISSAKSKSRSRSRSRSSSMSCSQISEPGSESNYQDNNFYNHSDWYFRDQNGQVICRDKILGNCSKNKKDCKDSHDVRNYPCIKKVTIGGCSGKCGYTHNERKIYSMPKLMRSFFQDNYGFLKTSLNKEYTNPRIRPQVYNYIRERTRDTDIQERKQLNSQMENQISINPIPIGQEKDVFSTSQSKINMQGMPKNIPLPPQQPIDNNNLKTSNEQYKLNPKVIPPNSFPIKNEQQQQLNIPKIINPFQQKEVQPPNTTQNQTTYPLQQQPVPASYQTLNNNNSQQFNQQQQNQPQQQQQQNQQQGSIQNNQPSTQQPNLPKIHNGYQHQPYNPQNYPNNQQYNRNSNNCNIPQPPLPNQQNQNNQQLQQQTNNNNSYGKPPFNLPKIPLPVAPYPPNKPQIQQQQFPPYPYQNQNNNNYHNNTQSLNNSQQNNNYNTNGLKTIPPAPQNPPVHQIQDNHYNSNQYPKPPLPPQKSNDNGQQIQTQIIDQNSQSIEDERIKIHQQINQTLLQKQQNNNNSLNNSGSLNQSQNYNQQPQIPINNLPQQPQQQQQQLQNNQQQQQQHVKQTEQQSEQKPSNNYSQTQNLQQNQQKDKLQKPLDPRLKQKLKQQQEEEQQKQLQQQQNQQQEQLKLQQQQQQKIQQEQQIKQQQQQQKIQQEQLQKQQQQQIEQQKQVKNNTQNDNKQSSKNQDTNIKKLSMKEIIEQELKNFPRQKEEILKNLKLSLQKKEEGIEKLIVFLKDFSSIQFQSFKKIITVLHSENVYNEIVAKYEKQYPKNQLNNVNQEKQNKNNNMENQTSGQQYILQYFKNNNTEGFQQIKEKLLNMQGLEKMTKEDIHKLLTQFLKKQKIQSNSAQKSNSNKNSVTK